MSNRAKNLLGQLLDRIIDGPPCRNCTHSTDIHHNGKCLAAVVNDTGDHDHWCDCGKGKP